MPELQLQISGKDLGALALAEFCPLCFWLQRKSKLPWQIFPGIFSSIDSYSKKVVHGHFDAHGMPPWLAPIGELTGYVNPPSAQKFRTLIPKQNVLLTGAPDAVFKLSDGSLVIADYKTARFTPNQDKLLPVYRVQLNAYAYIAKNLGWPTINSLALIYTEPVTDEEAAASKEANRADGFALGFSAKILPIELDESMLVPLVDRAALINALPTPPQPRAGCDNCSKLNAIRTLLA